MTVLTRIDAGVATLTLNRPREMNAFDEATAHGIVDALEGLAADETVRVLVVAGEGPAFSAGGDFRWVLEWPAMDSIQRGDNADAMMGAVQAVYDFPKPSIARVQGAAVGGGIGLMLACDYAVAASSARFGLTSARNGLLAGIAIPVLIQAVGPRVARQLLMHGGMFDAEEARRIGLVDRVVTPGSLDSVVATLSAELKLGAPSVQMLIKKLVTQIATMRPDSDVAGLLGKHVANQSVSEEAIEGMSAFLAKRKPGWAV